MSFKIAAAAALATLASTVSAHGHVQTLDVSGTAYSGWNNTLLYTNNKPDLIAWSDTINDDGYVSDYTSSDMICHVGAQNGKLSAPVNGGETITFTWDTWAKDHRGPILTYLAKCDGDCANADKASLKWFKIEATGLISGDSVGGIWASDKLISNGFKWDIKIPSTIASGNYVVRHELIALHKATDIGGSQNYPQCLNLEIKSSGSDVPEGVTGTELYTANDAGLHINIFYPLFTSYNMPGPALYIGGSGPSSAASSTQASSTSVAAPSSYVAPASTSAQPTSYPAWSAQPTYVAPTSYPAWSYKPTHAPWSAQPSSYSTSAAPETTQVAVVTSPADGGEVVVTVTEIDVVTETQVDYFTAAAYKHRRHARAFHN